MVAAKKHSQLEVYIFFYKFYISSLPNCVWLFWVMVIVNAAVHELWSTIEVAFLKLFCPEVTLHRSSEPELSDRIGIYFTSNNSFSKTVF